MTCNATQQASLRSESHGCETPAIACLESDIRQLGTGNTTLDDQSDGALDHPPVGKISSLSLGEPWSSRYFLQTNIAFTGKGASKTLV